MLHLNTYIYLYTPCLCWANRFDRDVGYFTSGWLSNNIVGLSDFASRGGKIRLLTSPILSEEDSDAIINAEIADHTIYQKFVDALMSNVDDLKKEMAADIFNAFSWMIHDEIIDIKYQVALMYDERERIYCFTCMIIYDEKG